MALSKMQALPKIVAVFASLSTANALKIFNRLRKCFRLASDEVPEERSEMTPVRPVILRDGEGQKAEATCQLGERYTVHVSVDETEEGVNVGELVALFAGQLQIPTDWMTLQHTNGVRLGQDEWISATNNTNLSQLQCVIDPVHVGHHKIFVPSWRLGELPGIVSDSHGYATLHATMDPLQGESSGSRGFLGSWTFPENTFYNESGEEISKENAETIKETLNDDSPFGNGCGYNWTVYNRMTRPDLMPDSNDQVGIDMANLGSRETGSIGPFDARYKEKCYIDDIWVKPPTLQDGSPNQGPPVYFCIPCQKNQDRKVEVFVPKTLLLPSNLFRRIFKKTKNVIKKIFRKQGDEYKSLNIIVKGDSLSVNAAPRRQIESDWQSDSVTVDPANTDDNKRSERYFEALRKNKCGFTVWGRNMMFRGVEGSDDRRVWGQWRVECNPEEVALRITDGKEPARPNDKQFFCIRCTKDQAPSPGTGSCHSGSCPLA